MKITKITYHRNGVGGNGFSVVLFTWRDRDSTPARTRDMVAVLFDQQGDCAVLDVDETAKGNVEYPQNRWRGDDFEPELRAAVKAKYDPPGECERVSVPDR